jgi:hypothetical protein
MLLFLQLLVSRILFGLNLSADFFLLFTFSLLEQLEVLLLKILVHAIFLDVLLVLTLLLFQLVVKLLPDEALPLLISEHRLLLLFVVEEGVELHDGVPLVVFVELGEAISFGILLATSPRHSVSLAVCTSLGALGRTLGCSTDFGHRWLRKSGSA